MAARIGLFVNLDRCFGCFTCEVACQQEHRLPAGEKWIRMFTVGPTEVDGELVMDFVPLASDKCDLCAARRGAGAAAGLRGRLSGACVDRRARTAAPAVAAQRAPPSVVQAGRVRRGQLGI